MKSIKEKLITGYPNIITYECTKNILEQMENRICKIKIGLEISTGFFYTISFPDKKNSLPVLITNNHVIDNELLNNKHQVISIFIK